MMGGSPHLQKPLVKITPHIIDTIFLLSGIGLVVTLHLPVMSQNWLLMKFAALIVYIVLGSIALRRGRSIRVRATAYVLALLTFVYIVGVAMSKSTLSWIALISH